MTVEPLLVFWMKSIARKLSLDWLTGQSNGETLHLSSQVNVTTVECGTKTAVQDRNWIEAKNKKQSSKIELKGDRNDVTMGAKCLPSNDRRWKDRRWVFYFSSCFLWARIQYEKCAHTLCVASAFGWFLCFHEDRRSGWCRWFSSFRLEQIMWCSVLRCVWVCAIVHQSPFFQFLFGLTVHLQIDTTVVIHINHHIYSQQPQENIIICLLPISPPRRRINSFT